MKYLIPAAASLFWYHAKYSLRIYQEYSSKGYVFRYFG